MRPATDEPRPERRKRGKGQTRAEREREYDKTLADSFPASDPPAVPNVIGPGRKPAPSSDEQR